MQRTFNWQKRTRIPNCETEFVGYGDARRIIQAFGDSIVLENWLQSQRGIVRLNGRIVWRFERVTMHKWERTVRFLTWIAPKLDKFRKPKRCATASVVHEAAVAVK